MQQEENSIFVRNLDDKVTEELLYELFLQAGPLEAVRIPTVNGISRNFGFVVYTHEESVPYAIGLLDKTTLYGRPIYLKDAHPRNQNFQTRGSQWHVKERLGPHPAEDNSSLRGAPGFMRKRYNDLSMQPMRPAVNQEKSFNESRERNAWARPPGPMSLYPSQRGDRTKGHNSQNPSDYHMKHRNRSDYGGFSQSRKPYEKISHQRDNNRYDHKHFRRSK